MSILLYWYQGKGTWSLAGEELIALTAAGVAGAVARTERTLAAGAAADEGGLDTAAIASPLTEWRGDCWIGETMSRRRLFRDPLNRKRVGRGTQSKCTSVNLNSHVMKSPLGETTQPDKPGYCQ